MQHTLITERKYFNSSVAGRKLFEIRKNDRGFKVGDHLKLIQLNDGGGITGKIAVFKITSLVDDKRFVKKGYVVMGIQFSWKNFV